ncbi:hypothetical protein BJX64DRAFT_200906 [Aspergillus heterothallicus]
MPPEPSILDYPVDILLVICSFLPLPSRVCLALTCKALYNVLGDNLNNPRLAWPKGIDEAGCNSCVTIERLPPHVEPKDLPRTELLLRLQTHDNLYCAGCLKLHGRHEFDEGRLFGPITERYCRDRRDVVDLCHCLALTGMTGNKLRQWILTGIAPASLDQSIRNILTPKKTDCGDLTLEHGCTATGPNYVSLMMDMQLRLDNHCLVVRKTYQLRVDGRLTRVDHHCKMGPSTCPYFPPRGVVFGCFHRCHVHTCWFAKNKPQPCLCCKTSLTYLGRTHGEYEKRMGHEGYERTFFWETVKYLDKNKWQWNQTARGPWIKSKRLKKILQSME